MLKPKCAMLFINLGLPSDLFVSLKTLRPDGLTELVKVSKRVDIETPNSLSTFNAVVCLSRRVT